MTKKEENKKTLKKLIEEMDDDFRKYVVDYFWDKPTLTGTQRLSINQIERIEKFNKKSQKELLKWIVDEGEKIKEYQNPYSFHDERLPFKKGCDSLLSPIKSYLKEKH